MNPTPTPWPFPAELEQLKTWLVANRVDVAAITTERQALYFALKASKSTLRLPKPGAPCFPMLEAVQKVVCSKALKRAAGARKRQAPAADKPGREYGLGTFGAASPVRKIDPSSYGK